MLSRMWRLELAERTGTKWELKLGQEQVQMLEMGSLVQDPPGLSVSC